MATKKKLKDRVILFASVEREQHDALRAISFKSHRSIAELTRDALKKYIAEEQQGVVGDTSHHQPAPAGRE